jgi:hypothetical protein
MLYLLLVLDAMEAPWLAMQGRSEDAEVVLQRALERIGRSSLPQVREGAMGALLTVRLFQGRLAEELPRLRELAGWTDMPVTATLVAMLLRLGRREEAEGALVVLPPIDVAREDWFSMMNWGAAAEVALGLGMPELGAKAYVRLSPHAGRMCSGGSGAPQGPVHIFLAFAAAAAGETATATRHAELGLAQCRQWQIPPVEKWFRDQRDLHGF